MCNNKNCRRGCNKKTNEVVCGTPRNYDSCRKGCYVPHKENLCEQEKEDPCYFDEEMNDPINAKDVRYKIDCDEESKLSNLNIQKGDNLEYIIDVLGTRILDMGYVQRPTIDNHPELDSMEKVLNYIINRIDNELP